MCRITALLTLVYIVLFWSTYEAWEKREQEIYVKHATILETTYNTTVHLYQTFAETLYDEVINNVEVLQLMAEAYDAPPDRQARLRGRLYRLLYSTYNRLAKKNLRQLHFHFPDNSSFIRFHRLERYGDSLGDIRESIRFVNAHHKPIFGFENGRIYCGFRYVFPLQYKGKHIGSVETSVSFKAIQKSMQAASPNREYLFLQKKDIVMAKAFPSEQEIYIPVPVTPDYVVEDLRILGLDVENPVFPLARQLNPILGENRQVRNNIKEHSSFTLSINDQNKSYIVAGFPIRNIKGEQVAYILSYEEDDEIPMLWATFRNIIMGQTFLGLALVFFIWKRQEAMSKLKRNETRLSAITRYMGDSLYVNDVNGKITFINHAMEKQLGYSPSELLGKDAHNLFHRHSQQGTVNKYDECQLLNENAAGRTFQNDEDYFLHQNGSIIPVEVKGTPLQLEGRQRGSVVIFRDITDRLRAENDRLKVTKLESIGVLAGGLAHDFNNLLTAIMGNIELARMFSTDNPNVIKRLDEAQTASKRATKLTNQLRTFSEADSPVTSEVDLNTFLPDIVSFILSGSAIHSELIFADDLWPVHIDTDQIRQVIHNILINAIEAMGQDGTVTIRCSNHHGSDPQPSPQLAGKFVCITVQDTGSGIPGKHINKIFDPYFSTKRKGSTKGSGLGLSIVHSIIKKHKGHIEVESSEENGTFFSIYLPAITRGGNAVIYASEAPQKSGSGKILIMDDEIALLDMVSIMLNHLGYETEQAEDGEQAIKLYSLALDEGKPFDAVILDLTIKDGMGGEQTMAELQTIDPAVVAIVSSGYADAPLMADYQKYGFQDSVPKPFEMETLVASLNKVLAPQNSASK